MKRMRLISRSHVILRRKIPSFGKGVATKATISFVPVTLHDVVFNHQHISFDEVTKVVMDSVTMEFISAVTVPAQSVLFFQSKGMLDLLAQELMRMKGLQ